MPSWRDLGLSHYTDVARAYLRGAGLPDDPAAFARTDVALARFKRTMGLPRVDRVVSMLRGLAPRSILDAGSGRGAALWPILELARISANFGCGFHVTAFDRYLQRHLAGAAIGGLEGFSAVRADLRRLPFPVRAFDIVTVLEVLEHIADQNDLDAACRESIRVANRFVIVSVPSTIDDNPDHHRLFSVDDLTDALSQAGAAGVHVFHVRGHRIALASVT